MMKPSKTLVITDRNTGEAERIPEATRHFRFALLGLSEKLGQSLAIIEESLEDGQELSTAEFVYKLERPGADILRDDMAWL